MGLLLVQMAKRRGARVIGTVGTEEKAALAREAGADQVVLYTREDFVEAVRACTAGPGVDVVYDSVGKTTVREEPRLPRAARADGVLRQLERRRGRRSTRSCSRRKGSLFLTRPSLLHYIADRASLEARARRCSGRGRRALKVRIDPTCPLGEAAEAHRGPRGAGDDGQGPSPNGRLAACGGSAPRSTTARARLDLHRLSGYAILFLNRLEIPRWDRFTEVELEDAQIHGQSTGSGARISGWTQCNVCGVGTRAQKSGHFTLDSPDLLWTAGASCSDAATRAAR